jgi:spermidine synthase
MPLTPQIVDDDGRTVLLVGDVIQSVSPLDAERWGSYWAAMVPPFPPQRVLVLGLGGATLPHLIVKRWGAGALMTGVDDDPAVLNVAAQAGWLRVAGLQPVCADAFAFVRTCRDRFDYIGVDLYRGGAPPAKLLTRGFMQRLAALLDPSGWLCLNLYGTAAARKRLRAFDDLFRIQHDLHVGDNRIVHAVRRDGTSAGPDLLALGGRRSPPPDRR